MPDVSAADRSFPELVQQLLAAEVAPAVLEVAFVATLVDHHRLAPLFAAGRDRLDAALDAGVADPRPGVVEVLHEVVDRDQVAVRVLGGDQLTDAVPVRGRLGEEQVVLVGQREPDVGVPGQPADHVADHAVVDRGAEVGEAPPVVRVEQDQVRLYAELAEAPQLRVEPGEEVEVEPGVVERPFRGSREGEPLRLVGVEHEVLGEQAHPQLGERRRGQGVQGGLLQRTRPDGSRRTRWSPTAGTGCRPRTRSGSRPRGRGRGRPALPVPP